MKKRTPMAFFVIAVALALAGCGENTSVGTPAASTLADSQPCIGCHGTAVSPVTGAVIADEWKLSRHNTETPGKKFPGFGAGCRDCHEPEAGHPNNCGRCHGGPPAANNVTGLDVSDNPDRDLKCLKCHHTLPPPHFNNFTGVTHDAQFVDLQNLGKCRNCHNPHNTTILPEATAWAKSGHGDVTAPPWSAEDFKANKSCLRCHTATGYVNYVTSVPAFTPATGPLADSVTYGVLSCNACHASYNFKGSVRNVPAFTAPYNNNHNPEAFPSVGESNLCIPCHSGRENNNSITSIADFTNASFKNSHYMAAAGLMYMKTGFTSFTSAATVVGSTTYGKSLSPDASVPGGVAGGVGSTHRKLGTSAINGDSHNRAFFVPGVLDANGPCVTCHLNAYGVTPRSDHGHILKIDGNAYNQVCINCHTSEGATALTASNFQVVFLEEQAKVFENALTLIQKLLLNNYNIKFNQDSYPYFYDLTKDPTGATPVKDWTRGTNNQKFGQKMMGACFNLNLLKRDPAAYAHARTYSRRLIYDTIDFLDDTKLNLSVSATAVTTDPVTYGKGAAAYTDSTLQALSPGTTESMIYLIGWSRSTGAWNTTERP